MNIEIEEDALAELLDHAMTGMEEVGEYSPTMVNTFKELAAKLSVHAWNAEVIKEFAANLDNTIDGSDEDYSFILDDTNDYDDY